MKNRFGRPKALHKQEEQSPATTDADRVVQSLMSPRAPSPGEHYLDLNKAAAKTGAETIWNARDAMPAVTPEQANQIVPGKAKSAHPAPSEQWEYQQYLFSAKDRTGLYSSGNADYWLSQQGKQGWELVSVVPLAAGTDYHGGGSGTGNLLYVMKRRISS